MSDTDLTASAQTQSQPVPEQGTASGSPSQDTSSRRTRFLLWLIIGALAVCACALTLPAATLHGEYNPVGNDSFYHARRILDTAQDPGAFYQFDARIHAPEGSLLVWPWGYDYAMAWIVRIGVKTGLAADPLQILIWIPVAAVLITIALMLGITRRLGFGTWTSALGALCMALAPTTQLLHAVGQIDHHYAELIFVLAVLANGLLWLHSPEKTRYAIWLGFLLGVAPAIHNGLFILQAPLLITLGILWLQNKRMPVRQSAMFGGTLVIATLAVLIPSLPFRLGRFEFFTLSWFHLYAAACSAAFVVALSRLGTTRKTMAMVCVGAALALVPIVSQLALAQSFIAGTPVHLQGIGEMQSPAQIVKLFGHQTLTNFYSYLVWIAPLTGMLVLIQCWRERAKPRLLFWITSAIGLALLSAQIRLHYFGDFALYLPWLVLLQEFVNKHPLFEKKALLLASLALLLLYFPSLRYQLAAPAPRGNDMSFENIRPIFRALRDACATDPGIVLADPDAGHYIRYYTDCSVLADNFLLTPQQMHKVDEVHVLFSMTAADAWQAAPQVKYVMLRPFKIGPGPNGKLRYTFLVPSPRLANDLLLGTAKTVPEQYVLLDEVRFPELGNAPYAKLYKIERH